MFAFPFAHIARSVSVVLLNLFHADLVKGRTSPSGAPLALDPEHRNHRPLFRLFLLAFGWLLASLPALASTSLVWFSTSDNLFQISGESNTVVQTRPMSGVGQLAVDSGGVVWTVTDNQLSKRGLDGTTLFQADFKTLGLHSEPTIAVDPYDNSLWLADKKTVLHLDTNGQYLRSFPTPFANVRQIQVSPDQTLWMLGNKQLAHYSASGVVIASFDLHAVATVEPKFFIVDDLGRAIWLAGEKNLIQVDLASAQQVLRRVVLGDKVIGLVLQPKNGAVWALSKDSLATYDATGTLVRNIVFKSQAISGPDMLVFDPVGDSVWMTHHAGVARFSLTGDLRANIATQKSAQEIAAVPFILLPEISLVSPANGLLTNKPNLPFTLQYGVSCNGQPCTFTTSYLGTYSLNAILNGQAVGNLFAFDTTSGKATFTPTSRLPEGINTFTAQARDSFGHLSNSASSTFTIDTILPTITDLTPVSGTVMTVTPAKLLGRVSEPATVRVGGKVINIVSDDIFTYDAALQEGINSLLIEATDAAGNIGSRALVITLDTVPPEFVVLQPESGTITNRASIEISGKLSEAATLTLGAELLSLASDRTFAKTVVLVERANKFVLKATDRAGNSASRTINITRDTVAPKMLNLTPVNGMSVNVAQVRISGAFDDARSVTLDGAGSVQTSSGPTFAFDVTLQAGGNTFVLRAADTAGNATQENVVFTWVAYDPVDAPFMTVWDGMNDALKARDIEKALTFLTSGAQEKFRPVFEALIDDMPAIIASYSKPSRGLISDDLAEYAIMRFIDAEGDTQVFFIYFVKTHDGKWLVDSM